MRMRILAATLVACGLLASPAQAKVKVSVLGWTTQAGSSSPQVANAKTIGSCLDMGNGQRTLRVVYKGKGIKKSIKVGVGVWGGPPTAGFATEPSNADVMKGAFKWPVGEKKSLVQALRLQLRQGPVRPAGHRRRLEREDRDQAEGRRPRDGDGGLLTPSAGDERWCATASRRSPSGRPSMAS